MKTREDFLREAESLINGPRAKDYGPARKNHQRIADMWSIILEKKLAQAHPGMGQIKCTIDPEEVVACMIALKLARLAEDMTKDDSWTDIIGYAALGGEIINDEG